LHSRLYKGVLNTLVSLTISTHRDYTGNKERRIGIGFKVRRVSSLQYRKVTRYEDMEKELSEIIWVYLI
jgi:hypothetical protein